MSVDSKTAVIFDSIESVSHSSLKSLHLMEIFSLASQIVSLSQYSVMVFSAESRTW